MEVDWSFEVVDQVDSHWRHQLRPRLVGLTDDEYAWEPDFGETRDPEPVTTIAWRLAHLILGLAESNAIHFGGPPADASPLPLATTADHALSQLDETYQQWIAGVRSLGVPGLARPQGSSAPPEFAEAPMARLILYTSVEVIHHGAEICLLRDLYRRNVG